MADTGPAFEYDTLTRISESFAVLYNSDCWMLDLKSAIKVKDPSLFWRRIPTHLGRYLHATVLEPDSQKLWVIGGYDNQRNIVRDILELSFNLVPLKALAIDCAAHSIRNGNPRLHPGNYPSGLRKEIELYRSKVRETYLCNSERGCVVCQEAETQ